MGKLTREQIDALRHLTLAVRFAFDEVGNPWYEGPMVKSVAVVESLINDAEENHVRREHPRLLVS